MNWTLWIFGLAPLLLLGCGETPPATFPVAGRVEFPDGEPVRTGYVEFFAIDLAINARGEIARDGTFQLTTFHPDDGAVVGLHRVVVVQFLGEENLAAMEHHHDHGRAVATRFADYSTSGLTCEITPTEANRPVLVVEPNRS